MAAFDAAHVVNAVLFASAAIPIYLLARRVVPPELRAGRRPARRRAAVGGEHGVRDVGGRRLPGLRLGRARLPRRARASRRRAVTRSAIGGLALAFFTRPQFLFLAARAPAGGARRRRTTSGAPAPPLLAGAYAAAIVVVVPLAALGEAHRLLGDYGVTATEGSLLPSTVWKSAAIHLDVLAVGLGVMPVPARGRRGRTRASASARRRGCAPSPR